METDVDRGRGCPKGPHDDFMLLVSLKPLGNFGDHLLNAHNLVEVSGWQMRTAIISEVFYHSLRVLTWKGSLPYPPCILLIISQANHIAMLRRSGRIPVADGLKTFNLDELMYVEPHYYQFTNNLAIRRELNLLKR